MSTFVIADIHNRYEALGQCIERSGIDREKDTLISLGDLCDGPFTGTREVLDTLHTFKNFILCAGNHDRWFIDWVKTGIELPLHIHQGGYFSLLSYDFDRRNVPWYHLEMLESAVPYYIDKSNNLYVHGGFDERYPIEEQDPEDIMWNRDLVYKQCLVGAKPLSKYNRVFFGHSSTQGIMSDWGFTKPSIS